jgi:hypothetical protein
VRRWVAEGLAAKFPLRRVRPLELDLDFFLIAMMKTTFDCDS